MPDDEKIRRLAIVKVTLSEQERALLQSAADAAGIPLSIYVRAAALEKAKGERR